jgi:membrane protein required for colicin V production
VGETLNAVDIAVVVVLLASGVFALMRGFVYEVLAVTGWVAAILAAIWGLPYIRPYVHPYISNQMIGDIAGGFVVFLVVLLLSSMVTHAIARRVRSSAIGSVDRSLGFAFGLARGLFLASLCFLATTKFTEPQIPEILATARTRPLMATGADIILSLLPAQLSGAEQKAEEKARQAAEALKGAQQTKEMYDQLSAPQPKQADPQQKNEKPPAYDNHGLERLIETNGK